jgi:hypothetical protein
MHWDSRLVPQVGSVYDDTEIQEVSRIRGNGQPSPLLVADSNSHSVAAEVRKRIVIFVQVYRQYPFRRDASQGQS